jgi:hypothetical protein
MLFIFRLLGGGQLGLDLYLPLVFLPLRALRALRFLFTTDFLPLRALRTLRFIGN